MTSCCQPNTIITGDYLHVGFDSILIETASQSQHTDLLLLLDSANEFTPEPDLIAVFQSRRGQFTQQLIDRVRNRFPLAALVIIYGPWCEGETRSGHPIDGPQRITWHRWPLVHREFCSQFEDSGLTQWHCSDLFNRVDQLLDAEHKRLTTTSDDRLRVMVSSYRREGFELVSDACSKLPHHLSWQEDARQVPNRIDLAVINASFGLRSVVEKANALRARYGRVPIIVIAGFVRHQDVHELAAFHPVRLLGKPLDNLELQTAISEAVGGLGKSTENQVA